MGKMQQHFVWLCLNSLCCFTEQEKCDCFRKMEQHLPLYFMGASQFARCGNRLYFVVFWPEQDEETIHDGLCRVLKEMAAQLSGTSSDIFAVRAGLLERRRHTSWWKLPFYRDLLLPHTITFEPRLLVLVVLAPWWVCEHPDLSERVMLEFTKWFLKEYPDSEQNECQQGHCVFFTDGGYLLVNAESDCFVEQLWECLSSLLTPQWEEAIELVTASVELDGYLTSPSLNLSLEQF